VPRKKSLSLKKPCTRNLLNIIATSLIPLQQCAAALAELDVLVNFARNVPRPSIYRNLLCLINPAYTIEAAGIWSLNKWSDIPFVPNDLSLSNQRRMLVITGPIWR